MNIFRSFEVLFDLLWHRVQKVWLEAAQATATLAGTVSPVVGVHGCCGDNLEDWCECMV